MPMQSYIGSRLGESFDRTLFGERLKSMLRGSPRRVRVGKSRREYTPSWPVVVQAALRGQPRRAAGAGWRAERASVGRVRRFTQLFAASGGAGLRMERRGQRAHNWAALFG